MPFCDWFCASSCKFVIQSVVLYVFLGFFSWCGTAGVFPTAKTFHKQ
uniref:Uncharacterized protein n=1 Tax=Anguilla anguilla TaxID=7936 RepID=A0A0E9S8J2_ANGAN